MRRLLLILVITATPAPAQKPVFDSGVVTKPKRSVAIDVPLGAARDLFLVATDGGDGFSCDWADWAEPRLSGPKGELRLTDLKWKRATSGWGQVRRNANASGGPLMIDGTPVEYGIGTHANSLIHFEIPPGYTRFKARAGLDMGGTTQGDGSATSVRFRVYTKRPPRSVVRPRGGDSAARDAKDALAGLDTPDDLEATLFAAEPLMLSPSNMDVDHLGRVWICEIVNYRHFRNRRNQPREAGDRILILEDTDGDGKADKTTTFYQGRDIDSAHGLCVLGDRVIVSANASVFVLTDTDGDSVADKKDTLFTGISGTQHDHGIHAFVFGPDGKLYFNFGNEGRQIKDKDDRPITDQAGNLVTNQRRPYQEGMVFRCNVDGSELETLGWNFRNNWEVCVDSFGTLWQSDNDDDGNRGVRINFVMEYGNYGYKDELTGAGWRSPRTGIEKEIPRRHWHLNDPGVVPNLLQTGGGSPTGICVYEGDLLPQRFRDQLIHCDAGPNIVRCYPVTKHGAGYTAEIADILEGTRDKWFRPSDVCVAPDGSLLIADWYDPGVGGHGMGDISRGRIFRIAPPGTPYRVPETDFRTPDGAARALRSPNAATRFLAWRSLQQSGAAAEQALLSLWNDSDARDRARALWLLARIPGRGEKYLQQALTDADPDIRIVGLRIARQSDKPLSAVTRLVNDSSPAVRRECLIALREIDTPELPGLWRQLADAYDGNDRWYLEALGIAADGRWDKCLAGWTFRNTPVHRDIVWRSRSRQTPDWLASILLDPATSAAESARYLRAFDFQDKRLRRPALVRLAFGPHGGERERNVVVRTEALNRLGKADLESSPRNRQAIERILKDLAGTSQYLGLVDRFELSDHYPHVLKLAQQKPADQIGIEAARLLLRRGQGDLLKQALTAATSPSQAVAIAEALGNSADGRAAELLVPVVKDADASVSVRRAAVRAAGKLRNATRRLVQMAEGHSVPEELRQAFAAALHASGDRSVKAAARRLFPPPPSKDNKPLPTMEKLARMRGNIKRGRLVFHNSGTCFKCHQENGLGREVGPDLSEIGRKLSRQALFESILYPSASVSHNFETWIAVLENGNSVSGIKTDETDQTVSLKDAEAIVRTFNKDEIDELVKQDVSLMPADLQKLLTAQDLVDVVAFMQSLKQAKR